MRRLILIAGILGTTSLTTSETNAADIVRQEYLPAKDKEKPENNAPYQLPSRAAILPGNQETVYLDGRKHSRNNGQGRGSQTARRPEFDRRF